jgi:hypothetical protein
MRVSWLRVAGLTVVLFVGGTVSAADKSATKDRKPETGGLADIVEVLGQLRALDLSGLIKPQEMELLTDNQCRIKDNEAHLFSGNEAEIELLSGNKANLLSGIRILSDFSVDIHVNIQTSDSKTPSVKAKKRNGKRKSHKSRNRRARAKSKGR